MIVQIPIDNSVDKSKNYGNNFCSLFTRLDMK